MGFILLDFSALNRPFKAFEDQLKRIYHLSVWVYFSELSLFNSVSHSVCEGVCAISRCVHCKKKLYKTLIKVCVVFLSFFKLHFLTELKISHNYRKQLKKEFMKLFPVFTWLQIVHLIICPISCFLREMYVMETKVLIILNYWQQHMITHKAKNSLLWNTTTHRPSTLGI